MVLREVKPNTGIFLYIVIFLINPFLGIMGTAWRIIKNRKYFSWSIMLILMIAFYMAAINTTKIPVGDEEIYILNFKSVPNNGFWGTLSISSIDGSPKEVLYGVFIYSLYYLLFGNETLFIFVTSFLIYYLFLLSICKFSKEYKTPLYITISGILVITFFTQYFNLTAHLIRQFLATSFFFYGLSFRKKNQRKSILLTLLSFGVHSTMAVLIVISLIPNINSFLSYKKLFLCIIGAFTITTFLPIIAGTMLESLFSGDSGTLGYGLARAAGSEGLKDAGEPNALIINLFTIPLLLLSLWGIKIQTKIVAPLILNMCLIMCLFVLSLSFSPLLQYRFFYILFYFLPFVLFIPFHKNLSLSKSLSFIVCLFLIIRFYLTYDTIWDYVPIYGALLYPLPFYFFNI